MAQSLIERPNGHYFDRNEKLTRFRGERMNDSNDGGLLNSSSKYPEENHDDVEYSLRDGDDIIDTAVNSPSTPINVLSRRKSSTSHRRKSTPKKRAWEPAVYSDGESAHEESYSASDDDDDDDDLEASYSSSEHDLLSQRLQLAARRYRDDLDDAGRLVIDERGDLGRDSSSVSTTIGDAKDSDIDAALSMRIKSEPLDDYPKSGRLADQQNDVVTSEQKALIQSQCTYQDTSLKKTEHPCPFCHFVYTSVNYLLSHLYRVHITVDPHELQRAIAGVTAPYKNGQNKSTQYSRSPHMDASGRIVAPPPAPERSQGVLAPINLSVNAYDSVDGDLPPAKKARVESISSSPCESDDELLSGGRRLMVKSTACTKCNTRFTSRHQLEVHTKRNACCTSPVLDFTYEKLLPSHESFLRHQLMNIVKAEKKVVSNECVHCGKQFDNVDKLDSHIREHRSHAPMRCETCELWFSDQASLDQHRALHDGELRCQFCGGVFTQMSVLKRHTETHLSVDTLSSLLYDQQSSPSATESDKENSPDQTNSIDEKSSNSGRKHLLAELMQGHNNNNDSLPTNLSVQPTPSDADQSSKVSSEKKSKNDAYQHQCTMCHTSCTTVVALVEHISKCHATRVDSPIMQQFLSSQQSLSYPMSPELLNASMLQNPLMNLAGFYPSIFMQNPMLMSGPLDPKLYPGLMQPNLMLNQLNGNTEKANAQSAASIMASLATAAMQETEEKSPSLSNTNLLNLLSMKKKKRKSAPEKEVESNNSAFAQYPASYPAMPPLLSKPGSVKEEQDDAYSNDSTPEIKRGVLSQSEAEKPFQCNQCKKRFKRNCHLQLHMRTHSDDLRSYRCPQCGMRFIQLRSLEMHLKTHSIEKPYHCQFCGKSFAQKYNLKLHIRTHTGEKPYKCSYCEMRFADPGSLNRHTRTHTGEKPYSCEYCGKRFAQKYNLHLHIRVHTHDRPFRCVYCDKRFAQKSNLLLHLKVHVEYLHQLQNGTLPNMAELLGGDPAERKGDGPVLPSEAELRIIESERKKIEDELVALESAELADKILSEDGARREKAMIFNKEELAAMGKMGLSLIGLGLDQRSGAQSAYDSATDLTINAKKMMKAKESRTHVSNTET